MRNTNQKIVKKLSNRSLKQNKTRNLFTVMAIILTSMLFTTVFSMCMGFMMTAEETTMREVGTDYHAGLKHVTKEEYEKITAHPLVKEKSYDILLGSADNIKRRQTEIRYLPDAKALKHYLIELTEGAYPQKEDEILVDTAVLEACGAERRIGEKVTLQFPFMGKKVEKTFRVSGYYQEDPINRASEVFVSEAYWEKLKGNLSEEDFLAWAKTHPEDENVGVYSASLSFSNASGIEDKVKKMITDAGYTPGKEIDYGINWAYMGNRLEFLDPVSAGILGGALLVILITGYLIIYNIFQISIIQDTHFYGLLKTVGTTKKQISKIVGRQALRLSLIGIPVGMALGYLIGKLLLPVASRFNLGSRLQADLHFHPAIFLFAGVFSFFTIWVGCRKPAKMAGKISPIEALKYTEADCKAKRIKKTKKGAHIIRMAISNMKRNRKKTILVISSMTFSVILLTVIMTVVGSFQVDQYLEQRLLGDFTIGSTNYTTRLVDYNFTIEPEFIKQADALPGIQSRDELWLQISGNALLLDKTGRERYRKFKEEGKLDVDPQYGMDTEVQNICEGKEGIPNNIYGYTADLLKNLRSIEGKVDTERFRQGGYVIVSELKGNDKAEPGDTLYHPGEKITLDLLTDQSQQKVVENDKGEVTDAYFEKVTKKTYEVMAVVSIPVSMTNGTYTSNGVNLIIPVEDLQSCPQYNVMFGISYQVEEEKQEEFGKALKYFTENQYPGMGYLSKDILEESFSVFTDTAAVLGIALSVVILVIGILNFVNAVLTGMISRKREFAVMQSIGMTGGQLKKMVIGEGLCYVFITMAISVPLGSAAAYLLTQALENMVMFFFYQFNAISFLLLLPVFFLTAVLAPILSFRNVTRESVVERLKSMDS